MAEREGFEPSEPLRIHMISNHAHSTTLPPLRFTLPRVPERMVKSADLSRYIKDFLLCRALVARCENRSAVRLECGHAAFVYRLAGVSSEIRRRLAGHSPEGRVKGRGGAKPALPGDVLDRTFLGQLE
jgi:hypothetical protein